MNDRGASLHQLTGIHGVRHPNATGGLPNNHRGMKVVGWNSQELIEEPEAIAKEHMGRDESYVIVGSVDWISAASLTGTKAQKAQAVGYLSIPAKSTRCTAWLASEDIVITNNHCIATDAEAVGARVSFN